MVMDELPEWTTEMDEDILKSLTSGLVLTPAVIADNIDRSREAVSRRLNTLEAGGLVEKEDRGKYRLAKGVAWALMTPIELSEEEQEEIREKVLEEDRMYHDKFGMSKDELHGLAVEEFHRLREERDGYHWLELYEEAEQNVIARIEEGE